MIPYSFVSWLKTLNKDFSYKQRYSERDQALRHEIWCIDSQHKRYLVRAWGDEELKKELKESGIRKIKDWFAGAHKAVKQNGQERMVKEMQKRNTNKTESRHKRERDRLLALASETKTRNVFKELADVKGL